MLGGDVGGLVERVADHEGADRGGELGDDLVGDRGVHEETLRGDARLPRVGEAGDLHLGHGGAPVAVGLEDERRVVAELETHRREMADRMMLAAPGLKRVGERRVRIETTDVRDALSGLWRGVAEAFHEPSAWLR